MAVGIGPGDADFADHDGVFVDVNVFDKARNHDHRQSKEQRESQPQGGILFNQARTVDQFGQHDGGHAGGSGADDEPDRGEIGLLAKK